MKYNIITEINGVKQYVRRFRIGTHSIAITMYTTNQSKAFDFLTAENASNRLLKL